METLSPKVIDECAICRTKKGAKELTLYLEYGIGVCDVCGKDKSSLDVKHQLSLPLTVEEGVRLHQWDWLEKALNIVPISVEGSEFDPVELDKEPLMK